MPAKWRSDSGAELRFPHDFLLGFEAQEENQPSVRRTPVLLPAFSHAILLEDPYRQRADLEESQA